MRRDLVGLGVALVVGGLAYGVYCATGPGPAVIAPSAVAAAEPPVRPTASARRSAPPTKPVASVTRQERLSTIAGHVRSAAQRYGLPESLVAAVISVESEFNPRAVSPRGALGLMQLMPATATGLGVRNALDPRENIDGGARHLRDLLDRFSQDTPLALAAYNAGAQAVVRHGGIPPYPETREFVTRVMSRMSTMVMPAVAMTPGAAPAEPPRVRTVRLTSERLRRGLDDGVVRVVLSEEASAALASAPVAAAAGRVGDLPAPATVVLNLEAP
jgi:hypothetical protein